MSVTIYDEENANVNVQINEWEQARERVERSLATLRVIRDRFPDAQDRGKYKTPRWWAASAHDITTHIDGEAIVSLYSSGARFAAPVLYVEIDGGRIYSSRPVDLVAAFETYCAGGCTGNLIDIMRATTVAAEAAAAKAKEEYEERERKQAAEDAERKRHEMVKAAQPVILVGESSDIPAAFEKLAHSLGLTSS